jgi:hypothetical protein
MDAFHKVLVRIYEISGGRDSKDIDLVDLLKAEGFLPSLENIKNHLSTESWISDSPRAPYIRITHWGVAEAKKALADPTAAEEIDRAVTRLKSVTRDFSIVVDEFIAKPTSKSLKPVEERLSELDALVNKVKSMV